MKNYRLFGFIFILSLMLSCVTPNPVYQMKSPCANVSSEELFNALTAVLVQENFVIKTIEIKIGYLYAEKAPEYNSYYSGTIIESWTIQHSENKITAIAKRRAIVQSQYGPVASDGYYNDNTPKNITGYWNIRNAIEKICGDKLIIEVKNIN